MMQTCKNMNTFMRIITVTPNKNTYWSYFTGKYPCVGCASLINIERKHLCVRYFYEKT